MPGHHLYRRVRALIESKPRTWLANIALAIVLVLMVATFLGTMWTVTNGTAQRRSDEIAACRSLYANKVGFSLGDIVLDFADYLTGARTPEQIQRQAVEHSTAHSENLELQRMMIELSYTDPDRFLDLCKIDFAAEFDE